MISSIETNPRTAEVDPLGLAASNGSRGEALLPVSFPQGLPGFPQHRLFALDPAEQPWYWLRSLDEGGPTFLVVDPHRVAPDLDLKLPGALPALVKAREVGELRVLAIVTLPGERGACPTLNLQGLLVINPVLGLGRQVVLMDSGYSVRTELHFNRTVEAA